MLPADEGMPRLQALARAGSGDAAFVAAGKMIDAGRVEDATAWLHGLGLSDSYIAGVLRQKNRSDEAITWYQQAAEAGDGDAARAAAELLARADRVQEALTWYQRAAEAGAPTAAWQATRLLAGAGRVKEAIALNQQAAEAGDKDAAWDVGRLLADDGRVGEAISWYQRIGAHLAAARLMAREGRHEEAIASCEQAARDGDERAVLTAAELLADAGRTGEALTWYEHAVPGDYREENPVPNSMMVIVRGPQGPDDMERLKVLRHVERACGADAVILSLERAVRSGKHGAIHELTFFLRRTGRENEIVTWLRTAAEAGSDLALAEAAIAMGRAGQVGEAVTWLRDLAQSGRSRAFRHAISVLEQSGHDREALELRRAGWEPRSLPGPSGSGARHALSLTPDELKDQFSSSELNNLQFTAQILQFG